MGEGRGLRPLALPPTNFLTSSIRRHGVFLFVLGHVPFVKIVIDTRRGGFDSPKAFVDGGQGVGKRANPITCGKLADDA